MEIQFGTGWTRYSRFGSTGFEKQEIVKLQNDNVLICPYVGANCNAVLVIEEGEMSVHQWTTWSSCEFDMHSTMSQVIFAAENGHLLLVAVLVAGSWKQTLTTWIATALTNGAFWALHMAAQLDLTRSST